MRPEVDDNGDYLDPYLVTRAEAAMLAGVPEATVRTWQRRGKLPVRARVGGKPRYHPDEVWAAEFWTRRALPGRPRSRPRAN